ncbi:metallophosphoesterase [Candidatus Moduliflexus flocculans]|uniref:Metallophosphoesterase n=1 Tax=Candidatus Moduliflexus flocculans TaxID=1499966 RepID=A0A0S6VRS1_9BACT|nr:metallophosphoesterase [Candidatus Moduliflexus flocculans]
MPFFVMFLTILFSVSFGVHYMVLHRLSRIFEFQYSWKVFPLFVLITANFLAVVFLSRVVWNSAMRVWWIAMVTYIGALWITFAVVVVYAMIQLAVHVVLPIPARVSQVVVIGVTLTLVLYSLYNARHIEVHTLEFSSPKLRESLTIVQLTDLHLGALNGASYVERIVAQTNALKPDLVALTGDLVDIGTTADILHGFNNLNAPAFFVWGNHDQFLREDEVKRIFSATPIRILKNETHVFQNALEIIGLDYIERQPEPHNDARPILASLDPRGELFTLLLTHAPLPFEQMDGHAIDLQLAGHTHAGQIVPFNFLVKTRYPMLKGFYTSGERAIYVSSGAGTWGPPMRLGTRSEITVIRLLPLPPDSDQQLLVRNE